MKKIGSSKITYRIFSFFLFSLAIFSPIASYATTGYSNPSNIDSINIFPQSQLLQNQIPFDNQTQQNIFQSAEGGMYQYKFLNNLIFNCSTSSNVTLDLEFEKSLRNRFFGIEINNSDSINVNFKAEKDFINYPSKKMKKYNPTMNNFPGINQNQMLNNKILTSIGTLNSNNIEDYYIKYSYDTFYSLNFEGKFDSISIFSQINSEFGINIPNGYNISWAIFEESSQTWKILPSTQNGDLIQTDLLSTDLSEGNISLSIVYFTENKISFFSSTLFYVLIAIGLISLIFGSILTNSEYRDYLLNRFLPINKGAHKLSMEQVLENETRNEIINYILENPGTHFNELLREVVTSPGNLAWHLDILETFKIIRKERVGQYLLYYLYIHENPISKLDLKLQKSRTTLEILQLIKDNPGYYQNIIAKRMNLNHKTITYHLDKLIEAEIIEYTKKGRKKLFYFIEK